MKEILTDDCDRDNNTLTAYFGGNGDIYIAISDTDENGIKTWSKVRISTSGGSCPTDIKIAAAELATEFEKYDRMGEDIEEDIEERAKKFAYDNIGKKVRDAEYDTIGRVVGYSKEYIIIGYIDFIGWNILDSEDIIIDPEYKDDNFYYIGIDNIELLNEE